MPMEILCSHLKLKAGTCCIRVSAAVESMNIKIGQTQQSWATKVVSLSLSRFVRYSNGKFIVT